MNRRHDQITSIASMHPYDQIMSMASMCTFFFPIKGCCIIQEPKIFIYSTLNFSKKLKDYLKLIPSLKQVQGRLFDHIISKSISQPNVDRDQIDGCRSLRPSQESGGEKIMDNLQRSDSIIETSSDRSRI